MNLARHHHLTAATVVWSLVLLVALLGLLAPKALKPIYVGLMIVTFPIGWLMTRVILLVLYFAVLTPVGLLMRLFGRDTMKRAFDRGAQTYWVQHDSKPEKERYFRQY